MQDNQNNFDEKFNNINQNNNAIKNTFNKILDIPMIIEKIFLGSLSSLLVFVLLLIGIVIKFGKTSVSYRYVIFGYVTLNIILFFSLIVIGMFFYFYYEKYKDIKNILNATNIISLVGILFVLVANLISLKFIRYIGVGDILDKSTALYLTKQVFSSTILYLAAIIIFIVCIILMIIKIVKGNKSNPNINNINFINQNKYNIADLNNQNINNNNINKIYNLQNSNNTNSANNISNSDNTNNVNNTYKSAFTKEDFDKLLLDSKKFLLKYKKIIILSCLSVVLIFGGIFGYKKIKYILKPDAIVSISSMDVEINIQGYDGYGKAMAQVIGEPQFYDVKDNRKYPMIREAIFNYEVSLDKKENLKNGDEVVATVKFNENNKLKLKYDKTEFKKTITVSGLPEIVKSYSDVKNSIKRIENKINESIVSNYSSAKNLKITKLNIFEKPMSEEDIKSKVLNSRKIDSEYELIVLYKVSYDEKPFILFGSSDDDEKLESREKLFISKVYNFEKNGDAISFYTSTVSSSIDYNTSNLEDYVNKLKLQNYFEVK